MPVVLTILNNRVEHLTRLKNLKSPRIEKMTRDKSSSLNPRRVPAGKFVAVSRSYFAPVLSRQPGQGKTVNSCGYLRGIEFVNQTSIRENHQGRREPKRRSEVSGSRASWRVAARQMAAAIDEIIVIVERGVRSSNRPRATASSSSGAVSSVVCPLMALLGERRETKTRTDRMFAPPGSRVEGRN